MRFSLQCCASNGERSGCTHSHSAREGKNALACLHFYKRLFDEAQEGKRKGLVYVHTISSQARFWLTWQLSVCRLLALKLLLFAIEMGILKNVSREQKGRSTPTKTVGPWQSISQNNKPFDNLTFCPPYSQTLT